MRQRQSGMTDAAFILRGIEWRGYAVSVHRMREYVELHAVSLTGDGPVHIARCEGDSGDKVRQDALALAEMGPTSSDG